MVLKNYIKTNKKGDYMTNQTNASPQGPIKVKEIDLKEHFTLIKKRIWILILITIMTTALGYVKNTYFTTPLYQSATRMIIGADIELMKTLQVLIRDATVLQKVTNELRLGISPEQLAQQISVGSVEGSQVVNLFVVDTDPEMAAKIANTTAEVFKSEVPNIVGFNNVKLLTKAKINPYPINDNENRNLVIAFMIGILIGIGVIYFLESLDDSVKSKDEIEDILGFTVLGTVSKMKKKNMIKKNNRKNSVDRGEGIGF
jgi:capsular polysaccharide biosynthesis protein